MIVHIHVLKLLKISQLFERAAKFSILKGQISGPRWVFYSRLISSEIDTAYRSLQMKFKEDAEREIA